LMAKRHQVDSGDATVSDLQIFYLQKAPASWLTKSSSVLDQSNTGINKFLEETSVSASRMSTFSTWVTTFGTLVALLAGGFIAVHPPRSTSASLTPPHPLARE